MREDVRVGSGVVAEPVVVVDADVAMLDELARHLLGHRRRRRRHRCEGRAAVTGEGPDAEGGKEEEESAAARERGRGEGWGEGAMRAGEKHGRGQAREGAGQPEHRHPLLFFFACLLPAKICSL